MSKLFQISEDDLAELERILPDVFQSLTLTPEATPRGRTQFRNVQRILVDVRWNYGPPRDVERIDADGPLPDEP